MSINKVLLDLYQLLTKCKSWYDKVPIHPHFLLLLHSCIFTYLEPDCYHRSHSMLINTDLILTHIQNQFHNHRHLHKLSQLLLLSYKHLLYNSNFQHTQQFMSKIHLQLILSMYQMFHYTFLYSIMSASHINLHQVIFRQDNSQLLHNTLQVCLFKYFQLYLRNDLS